MAIERGKKATFLSSEQQISMYDNSFHLFSNKISDISVLTVFRQNFPYIWMVYIFLPCFLSFILKPSLKTKMNLKNATRRVYPVFKHQKPEGLRNPPFFTTLMHHFFTYS